MNKYEFIEELRGRLRRLPPEDAEDAIRYYQEYFDEAGIEDGAVDLNAIGTPAMAASEILAQTAVRQAEDYTNSAKKGIASIGLILLAIFGAPIALPLAIALAVTVCALIFAIGMVILALFISLIAIGFSGLIAFAAAVTRFIADPATGAVILGVSFILIAVCILFMIPMYYLAVKAIPTVIKAINKILIRSKKGQRI